MRHSRSSTRPSAVAALPGANGGSSRSSSRRPPTRPPAHGLLRASPRPRRRRFPAQCAAAWLRSSIGKGGDLTEVPLDMTGVPPFHQKVYEVARQIPAPARRSPTARWRVARARPARRGRVGQALGRNPFAIALSSGARGGGQGRRLLGERRNHHQEAAPADGATGRAGTAVRRRLRVRSGGGGGPPARCRPQARAPHGSRGAVSHGGSRPRARSSRCSRRSIVYQQPTARPPPLKSTGASAGSSRRRADPGGHSFCARRRPCAGQFLYCCARCKIWSAAATLPTLAEARVLGDEALIERLTAVRGIGRWTVEMVLMFRLGRPDVLPVGDFGVRKGFGVTFTRGAMPEPEEVAKRGARWAPYRTVASWYLWRAAELAPKAADADCSRAASRGPRCGRPSTAALPVRATRERSRSTRASRCRTYVAAPSASCARA